MSFLLLDDGDIALQEFLQTQLSDFSIINIFLEASYSIIFEKEWWEWFE